MVLSFTLVLCPVPAGSMSWCCRLLYVCIRLQPALCRGTVVYSLCASGSSPLRVVVPSFTLVLRPAPAGSVSWRCRSLSFYVLLQPDLYRGVVVYSRFVFSSSPLCVVVRSCTLVLHLGSSPLCVVVLSFIIVLRPAPAGSVS